MFKNTVAWGLRPGHRWAPPMSAVADDLARFAVAPIATEAGRYRNSNSFKAPAQITTPRSDILQRGQRPSP